MKKAQEYTIKEDGKPARKVKGLLSVREYNLTLYNCCHASCEPDWGRFDALEIHAVADYGGGCEPIDKAADLREAQFFTVYGHINHEGVEAITDVSTVKMAREIAEMFSQKIVALSGSCPVYDYTYG